MDKSGRIGILTNLETGKFKEEGKGRGRILIDFLGQNEISAFEYLDTLARFLYVRML